MSTLSGNLKLPLPAVPQQVSYASFYTIENSTGSQTFCTLTIIDQTGSNWRLSHPRRSSVLQAPKQAGEWVPNPYVAQAPMSASHEIPWASESQIWGSRWGATAPSQPLVSALYPNMRILTTRIVLDNVADLYLAGTL